MGIAKIEKIVYQTGDRQEFDDEKEAERHESIRVLTEFLYDSDIYWREDVDPREIANAILTGYILTPRIKGEQ